MASNKNNIKYKCPFCEKRYTKQNLVRHIDDNHEELVPQDFTTFRYVFNYVNKKPLDYHGRCTECKGPTDWDENKGRYNRQCNNPACKESFIKKFEANMIRTQGVTRISSTPEGLEKMLANRKISGKYKFKNGEEKTYTGSYELKTLEFMDQVLNISPDDIISPGPVLEYYYEGTKHLYITDFYYQPYNLIIEVKDGGNRPNKRNMPEYRAKQIAKEQFIIKHTNYNYIRLTDNNLGQLLSVFADLKLQMVENTGERVIHINEAMDALFTGYIPGIKDTGSVYIVNYTKNNVFSGEEEKGYGVSDNCKLTNLICRNKEGILEKAPDDFLKNTKYDVFLTDKSIEEVSRGLEPYMGTFVEEGFIYETIFGKKMYTYDQIMTEDSVFSVVDYYKGMELFKEVVKNYIIGDSNKSYMIKTENSIMSLGISDEKDKLCVCYMSLKENVFRLESVECPDLFIESDHYMDNNSIEKKFLDSLIIGGKING